MMDCEQIESNNIADLYLMGKLGPFERAQFEIHFISCRKCADMVAEVQDFREALRAAEPEFERFRSKAIAPRRRWSPQVAALVAAAAVAIALIPAGLLLRDNLRLRRQLSQAAVAPAPPPQPEPQPAQPDTTTAPQNQRAGSEPPAPRRDAFPSSPQINLPIFVISAVRNASAGGGEGNEIALDASPWFVLSIELENRKFEIYRAKIFTSERRLFWQRGKLRPDSHDAINVGLSSGFFREGDYLLVLEGRAGKGSFEAVATYPFRAVRKKVK